MSYVIDRSAAVPADPSVTPERDLWGSVLLRAVEDACGLVEANGGTAWREAATRRAADWVGSKDFHIIATYAGFDSDALAERLKPILALPVAERRKWWRNRQDAVLLHRAEIENNAWRIAAIRKRQAARA